MRACVSLLVCKYVCGHAQMSVCVFSFVFLVIMRRLSIVRECDYACVC